MGMASQNPAATMSGSKLMQRHECESPLDFEKELQQSFSSLQSLLTPPLNLSHSSANNPQLPHALLYGILTNPVPTASSYLNQLTALTSVTGDGYNPFVTLLLRLVNECYPKLLDQPRSQVLWLLRQLITFNAADIDNLCVTLLRQVAGGDLSAGNIWLATQLLEVLQCYEQWLFEKPHLFTMALYTYLRLLPDHTMGKNLNDLKQKEILFCTKILREKFQDCLMIGRDLIRLLQDVALLPEFELIWRDLLTNPGIFKAPGFTDIGQLYGARTPTRYLASRITPDMETQIKFMLTSVRMGNQRRYQTWFAQRYLFTQESETLVCDLIRFICCVIHPTNQILQSDIVPRWAIVGWLLKCCKSNHVEANAKLALFYDWLFFMTKTDNIMNIEPAILLMVHSIPKYVDMTHSLLEFLFLLVENYDPGRRDLIQKGVTASIDILIGKGVVQSLKPLSASGLVNPALREKLNYYFPAYCKPDTGEPPRIFRADSALQDGNSGGRGGYVPVSSPMSSGGVSLAGVDSSPIANSVQASETSGSSMDESKQNDVSEVASRKRRRPGSSEAILSEVQAHVEGLAEALTQSEEAAMIALEKLLVSFLAASDQMNSGKLAKIEVPPSSEGSLDSPVANQASELFSASSLAVLKFATQVVNMLRKGGYEIFRPLTKIPMEKPDADETMSLTSTLLHFYVVNNHPQLRQLLVAWDREGLAVGPRLLCYASRLAEEREVSASANANLKTVTGGSETEKLNSHIKLGDEGPKSGASSSPNAEEVGDVVKNSGKVSQEHSKNGGDGSPFAWNHRVVSNSVEKCQKLCSKETVIGTCAVNAFKAYEDFLQQMSKEAPISQAGDSSTPSNHNLVDSSSTAKEGEAPLVKTDTVDTEGESPYAALVRHLETCFIWNTQRLVRLLPSIFRYIPHLSAGREEIVLLLVSTVDPVDLFSYEFHLTIGDFAVIGGELDSLAHLIKGSLTWDSIEQQFFWRLLVAEFQTRPPAAAVQVVESCLAVVNAESNVDALSGLITFLRSQAPTGVLLSSVLFLSPKFGRFVSMVITGWMSSHYTSLLSCLQQLAADSSGKDAHFRKNGDNENHSDTSGLQRSERVNCATMATLFHAFEGSRDGKIPKDEKAAISKGEIHRALLKLTERADNCEVQGIESTLETAAEII